MPNRPYKVLLVEPDPEVVEMLVASLTRRFNAHITCVSTAEGCLDIDMVDPHDLVITELELEDSPGLKLTEQLTSLSARPVILLADSPTWQDAILAMRLGVRDLLTKPFPLSELLDSGERALRGYELRRQHLAKYRRMRELVRHVIRERRDLSQRIELICRDVVGAQRRLVHRVIECEQVQANSAT